MPNEKLRHALSKYLEENKTQTISLDQILHLKLLARSIHKMHKKAGKRAEPFLPIFKQLVDKAASL